MPTYSAYGLGIDSEFPLPELTASNREADISVRFGQINQLSAAVIHSPNYFTLTRKLGILKIDQVGTFCIREGYDVQVIPTDRVPKEVIKRHLLGNVLAMLLYQRGYLVLHASAVCFNGQVIAFLGASGSGKSSLALGMHQYGYDVVTDDITAIDIPAGRLVLPGIRALRISQDTAAQFDLDEEELQSRSKLNDKLIYPLPANAGRSAWPLSQIYILSDSSQIEITPADSQHAMIELIRHSIPTRYSQPGDQEHFEQCVAVAQQVAIYHLYRPRAIHTLGEVIRKVADHVQHYSPAVYQHD